MVSMVEIDYLIEARELWGMWVDGHDCPGG